MGCGSCNVVLERNTLNKEQLRYASTLQSMLWRITGMIKDEIDNTLKIFQEFKSIQMRDIYKQLKLFSGSPDLTKFPILITGETGTGKTTIAEKFHEMKNEGEKGDTSFKKVLCGEFRGQDSYIAHSKLFGHKKGAYTDARDDRKGYFETANKGTIFLDEIGETPLETQVKLLRVLETGEFMPVGASKMKKTDVRVIAATNKNLQEEIATGRFREDLYHRLSVILIQVPALNDRREDIPLLTEHFAKQIASEYGNAPKPFSEDAMKALMELDWTGNIRELRNVIERLIILSAEEVSADDVQKFARK